MSISVSSSTGWHLDGYLVGLSYAWARRLIADGYTVELQGPSSRDGNPKLFAGKPRPTASNNVQFNGLITMIDNLPRTVNLAFGPDELAGVSKPDQVEYCDMCGAPLCYGDRADSGSRPWVADLDGERKTICGLCVDAIERDEEAPNAD